MAQLAALELVGQAPAACDADQIAFGDAKQPQGNFRHVHRGERNPDTSCPGQHVTAGRKPDARWTIGHAEPAHFPNDLPAVNIDQAVAERQAIFDAVFEIADADRRLMQDHGVVAVVSVRERCNRPS